MITDNDEKSNFLTAYMSWAEIWKYQILAIKRSEPFHITECPEQMKSDF